MERVSLALPKDAPMRLRMEEQYSRMIRFALLHYNQLSDPLEGEELNEFCDHIGGELYRKIFDDDE